MPRRPAVSNRGQSGFSLIEMAIAVAVFGLLMSGMVYGMSSFRELRSHSDSQWRLRDIERAVSTFVISRDRLPCPAPTASTTGQEDCTLSEGVVPWSAIGVLETDVQDGWRRKIDYAVTSALAAGSPLDCSSGSTDYTAVTAGTLHVDVDDDGTQDAGEPLNAAYTLRSAGGVETHDGSTVHEDDLIRFRTTPQILYDIGCNHRS